MKRLFALTASALVAASMAGAPAFAADTKMSGKTVVENAIASKSHTTLVAAVKAAGLVETLSGEGPFTVFAPTDAAFKALPKGTVETLLKPENKAQLQKILTYHVVPANVMSGALVDMIKKNGGKAEIKTVSGDMLTAAVKNGKVIITDESGREAMVTAADVKSSNGVIHVVDTVLLPK